MILLFLEELGLFAATQLIGLFIALRIGDLAGGQSVSVDLSAGEVIIFLVFFTAAVYLLSHFVRRSGIFFRLVLGLAVFAGSQTFFLVVLGNYTVSVLCALFLAVLVSKIKIVFLHNLGMIIALAGIGAVLGLSLSPVSVIFLLLILSFYDIVAVYKTGHMVRMAEEMVRSRAISGIVLPRAFSGWKSGLQNVRPGGEFMILGSGDIIMPLILIASVAGLHGLARGLLIMLFSMAGLSLTYYLFMAQKERRAMAALPPIAALSVIGYLISVLM